MLALPAMKSGRFSADSTQVRYAGIYPCTMPGRLRVLVRQS